MTASRGISESSYGSKVGPSVFPFLLGAILIGLSLAVVYGAVRGADTGKRQPAGDYRRLGALAAGIVVYILAFEPLGYVVSTSCS